MNRSDLHDAALEGRVEDIGRALAGGGDATAVDDAGFTPLHFAAQHGQTEAAGVLLQAGAALEARNEFGNTPLWVALMNVRDGDGGVVRLLLAAGASLDAANDTGVSPRDLVERSANYDLTRFLDQEQVPFPAVRAGCRARPGADVARCEAAQYEVRWLTGDERRQAGAGTASSRTLVPTRLVAGRRYSPRSRSPASCPRRSAARRRT